MLTYSYQYNNSLNCDQAFLHNTKNRQNYMQQLVLYILLQLYAPGAIQCHVHVDTYCVPTRLTLQANLEIAQCPSP